MSGKRRLRAAGRLGLAAVLALAGAVCLSSAASAGFFDRIAGRDTYETFEGKFIDTDTAKTASSAAVSDAATKGFGGEGHFVGSPTWDGIPSPALHAYVETILGKLLAAWSGPHPQMRLWITANPGLEAESNSAGDLFIARGWFDQVESEDEIAAVLAHEVSHVLLGHFSRDDEHERNRMAVSGAASVASTALTISSLRPEGTGADTKLGIGNQSHLNHQIRDAAMIKFAFDEVSNVAVNAPWAREQEDQADLLGIDLLYRAHYNVLAMRDVLQRLADYEKTAENQQDQLSKQLQDSFSQSLTDSATSSEDLSASLGNAAKSAMWSILGSLNDTLMRAHPHTADRIDGVSKYIAREYEDDPGPPRKTAEFKKFMANPAIKAELAQESLAAQASAMTDTKDRKRRLQLAMRAAAAGKTAAPFPLRVLAQAVAESASSAKALPYYQRAEISSEASFATVSMLAGVYADAGDFAKAHATLEEAARRFGSPEAIYPALIQVDLKQKDQAAADQVYKQCLNVKNEDLAGECKRQHGDSCTADNTLECAFKGSSSDIKQTGPTIGH